MNYPLLSFFHLIFSTLPTPLSQNLLIYKNHTVKPAYKEHGSVKKSLLLGS